MWHRFGQGLDKIISRAAQQAESEGGDLSTRHLLRALAAEGDLPAARLLARAGCDTGSCRGEVWNEMLAARSGGAANRR